MPLIKIVLLVTGIAVAVASAAQAGQSPGKRSDAPQWRGGYNTDVPTGHPGIPPHHVGNGIWL